MTTKTQRYLFVFLLAATISLASVKPCLAFDWSAFGWIDGFKLSYSAFSTVIDEERWRLDPKVKARLPDKQDTDVNVSEYETKVSEEKQQLATRHQKMKDEKGEIIYYLALAILFVISLFMWGVGLVCGFFAGLLSLFEWFMFRLLF